MGFKDSESAHPLLRPASLIALGGLCQLVAGYMIFLAIVAGGFVRDLLPLHLALLAIGAALIVMALPSRPAEEFGMPGRRSS